ncbi:winged helix-turn-helix domain-containing protein [Leptospira sp. GIMC2001]|uniref:winged helix-turn-helix domain-containing protein n=1 Tax=Leptospira sp. GIMC2001 TaxID=1513297 RepID=UPI00234A25D3|nr:winged helix-turn-helix domain-containing protein [Leptospira sp. GIMC2001]WCL51323.1 winged helix-turn-helix domain-containing protein [Leptospira sp. GIMC2001]WCL51326.1 winged helix-turn-helix domain-containing protein [Leptospira sp. GIMC2001]WCL51327.1 winged helix-turn-helix domain-containing protein [Leptospira sp. GIMC2001]
MVLDGIFGNKTASKVLIHLFHYNELHASAIAKDYGVALTPIKNQLERFEKAGVLVSKNIGKSRVYSFNPKSPFVKGLKLILEVYYNSLSINDKEILFSSRRRPRDKGKPVYGRT